MKIGLFVKDFAVGKKFSKSGFPTKSGAEFHAENHAKELAKRGHEVTIMAKKRYFFTKASETLAGGVKLIRLHPPFRWLEILVRLFTTHRDFAAFYIIGTPKFAVWPIIYAKLMKKPVTLALTGRAELFAGNNWRNRLFAGCTNYIALSHEIRDGFIKLAHIPADRITILPHGIDTNRFPQISSEERERLRKKHGLSPNVPVLLFCARVGIDKGVDTLQNIWRKLHGVRPDLRLFVVGGGAHGLMDELKKLSAETGDTITLAGEVEEPAEYYQLADVYVFPSRHEGLPTTLMEAMSCGLASVVSDIGGCNDLIFDGETGFRVPAEEPSAFADKIMYLLAHDDERRRMGARSAAFARERCDYSVIIDKLAACISSREPLSHDYLPRKD